MVMHAQIAMFIHFQPETGRIYSSGAAFLPNPTISSPCPVRLRYRFLVETEMMPLTLTQTRKSEFTLALKPVKPAPP